MNEYSYIVFYDGVCGLCNQSIQFIIRHDKKEIFRFATLDSELAKSLIQIKHKSLHSIDSIILLADGKVYFYSDAVLRIFSLLGLPFNLFYICKIVPKPIRDFIYRWVARNRYKIWGKYDSCPIPSENQKKLFLKSR